MSTNTCDMCSGEAVQQFTTEAGNGDTITRCKAHQVPEYDWGTSWVWTLPKPDTKK